MPEGRTRGQTTAQTSDAGGVAQQPHFCTSEYPSTLSVRRRRRRDQSSLPVHGFPLALARVSPAVTHGTPPPEALLCVDVDAEEVLWVMSAYCLYFCSLFLLSFNIYLYYLKVSLYLQMYNF